MRKPRFIDHIQGPKLTPKQRENAQSVLKEIGRIIKDKRVIFVYTRQCRPENSSPRTA